MVLEAAGLGTAALVASFDVSSVAIIVGFATLVATRIFDIIDRREVARQLRIKTEFERVELLKHTDKQIDKITTLVTNKTDQITSAVADNNATMQTIINDSKSS